MSNTREGITSPRVEGTPIQEPGASSQARVSERLLDIQLKRHRRIDAIFRGTTRIFAFLVLLIIAGIAASLVNGAWPSIRAFGLGFITSPSWDPVAGSFGALAPIYGTLITSLIALLIAIPISFGIALFLTELSPRILRTPLGIGIELLAAIPSIIYGMWGLFVFAPLFARTVEPWLVKTLSPLPLIGRLFEGPPMGIGIFTSGLILAIMIIPFISSVMRDVFELVPPMLKESGYGLGATTWEVVSSVVLPHSKAGVIAGIMLGLGRALGETMAVTFVIGNSHDLSASIFRPGATISSSLANEFTEAVGPLYESSLIELGLILFVITFVVLALARLLLLRLQKQEGAHA